MNTTKMIPVAVAALLATVASAAPVPNEIAIHLLSSRYHLRLGQVMNDSRIAGLTPFNSGPLFEVARYARRTPREVAETYRSNDRDWNQTGSELGLRFRAVERMEQNRVFRPEEFWEMVLRQKYGYSDSQFDRFYDHGVSLPDTLTIFVIAQQARQDPGRVWSEYRRDGDWSDVARDYGINPMQWSLFDDADRFDGRFRPVQRPRWHDDGGF